MKSMLVLAVMLTLFAEGAMGAELAPAQRFFGTDAFVPDWRAAEELDAKAADRFLKEYWPKLKGNYDAGGSTSLADATANEKTAGVAVFPFPYMTMLLTDYLPNPAERAITSVKLFAARGESEPFELGVRTLDAAKEISIEVSDLKSGANVLSKQDISNRLAVAYQCKEYVGDGKYADVVRPMALLKTPGNAWKFPPNYTMGYMLDIHVPLDAKPGVYKGSMTVKAGGAVAQEVSVELEVLPFALKTNNFHAGAYGTTCELWAGGFTGYWPEMIEIDSRYGFNLAGGFFNKGQEIPFHAGSDGALEVDETNEKFKKFDATMKLLKKYGMGQVAFWNWGASADVNHFNNVLKAAGFGPIQTDEGKKGFAQICKAIKAAEKAHGWPEFVIGPYDEALNDQDSVREIIKACDLVHQSSPETRLYMTEWHEGYTRLYQSSGETLHGKSRPGDNAPVTAGEKPRLNFAVIGANTLSAAGRKLQTELGGEFWSYTALAPISPQNRYCYGFMGHGIGSETVLIWANYFGDIRGEGWTFHYLMPDNPADKYNNRGPTLPSVRALIAREGIDDRKYIETLRYYAQTKNSADDMKYLDELCARCRTLADTKNVGGVDNTTAKITQADAFQKIRGELKDRILKLVK